MPMSVRIPLARPVLPHDFVMEMVERKGVGHPDTLADGIAELASIRYAEYCLKEFGAVLHHNIDKVAVLGGRVRFSDTDGAYDRPLRVVLGGRASMSFAGRIIPVREILQAAALEQLRTALPGFDRIAVEVRHETTDSSKFDHWFSPRGLDDLPERTKACSNDTALLVGTAPRTEAETIALLAESWFRRQPWAGSDIKALVVREDEAYTVTVCVPALAGHLNSAADFDDVVHQTAGELAAELDKRLPGPPVRLVCNPRRTSTRIEPLSRQYFTLSGSAIDYGEDGLVGRGNARSGLITPAQAAGNEVTYGKNPAYHVGKVGAWLVDKAAAALGAQAGPCRVAVMWRNGAAYPDPATVEAVTRPNTLSEADAEALVREVLHRDDWMPDLVQGRRYLPVVEPVDTLLAALEPGVRR